MKNKNTNGKVIPKRVAEDILAARLAVGALREQMTFLRPLMPMERRHIKKVGAAVVRAARQRLEVARDIPEVIPSSFDLPLFEQEVLNAESLISCAAAVKRLHRDLQDTLLVIGSRASRRGAEVYGRIKAASLTGAHLHHAAAQLRTRRRWSRKTAAPEDRPPGTDVPTD